MKTSLTDTHTQAAACPYQVELLDTSDIPSALILIEKVRTSGAIEQPYHLKPKNKDYLNNLYQEGCPLLGIKTTSGHLIAFAAIYPLEDSGIVMMESVCTDPDVKRQGLASLLIQAAEDWAQENGQTHLTAKVSTNNIPSLTLFKRKGFIPSHHGADVFKDTSGQPHSYEFCIMTKMVAAIQPSPCQQHYENQWNRAY